MLLGLSLPLTGCLLDEEYETSGSRSRGVSLSQAMTSSASGSHESLHGSSGSSSESYTVVDAGSDVAVNAGSSGGSRARGDNGNEEQLEFPVDVAYAVPFNGEIQSITRISGSVFGVMSDYGSIGMFLSGDIVGLNPGTLPDNAIKNTTMFEFGFAYHRYLNPPHAFISPYLSANAALQVLRWDYRNPVHVDGDKIDADSLEGAGGYIGFGLAFNRNSRCYFFTEAGVGGTVFVDETNQGFHNDVFSNFGYFTVKAGLSLKF